MKTPTQQLALVVDWAGHRAGALVEVLNKGEHLRPNAVDRQRADNLVETGTAIELERPWQLKQSPAAYLTEKPEGKHAALATAITAAIEAAQADTPTTTEPPAELEGADDELDAEGSEE